MTLPYLSHPFTAMGSPCEIQLFSADDASARCITAMAVTEVERLESLYSRYRPDSLLSQINRVAEAGGSIKVDDETAGLINYADACFKESDGLFDITSGVLRRAWRFDADTLPDPDLIASLLTRIGWQRVNWQQPKLTFPPGMELDFGGIVKEYAVDRLATLCWQAGARSGFINLGGDIRIIGPRPDGTAWRIGLQHPRRERTTIGTLDLHCGAVASSGDYERCITINGERYGHVLNPRTGWPVKHLAAITVVSDFCVVAGSASTIAMLKEAEGPAWLQDMGLAHHWTDVHGAQGGSLGAGK